MTRKAQQGSFAVRVFTEGDVDDDDEKALWYWKALAPDGVVAACAVRGHVRREQVVTEMRALFGERIDLRHVPFRGEFWTTLRPAVT